MTTSPMRSRPRAAQARVLLSFLGFGLGLGLACLPACGGSDKPGPRTPANSTGSGEPTQSGDGEVVLPDAAIQASAIAATEAEAYEQAVTALRPMIFGPFLEADPSMSVHDRDQDLQQRDELGGGRIRVTIGLARERLEAVLQAVATQPLPAEMPPGLAEALSSPYRLFLEAVTCERRKILLADETCTQADRDQVAAAVEAVAREVRLRTRLTGGIPLDATNRALRPIEIVVERVPARGTPTPLAGVPVRIMQPEGVDVLDDTDAITDNAGTVRFTLRADATWPTGLRVSLDRQAFLGPLASMWPEGNLVPIGRPVNARRWALVVTERVQGNRARTALFGVNLDRAVRASGGEGMVALPPDALRRVTSASPTALPTMLPALGDELLGKLDVLIVAEIDSEFASRMGDYRVWYEARGRLHVFDVWTGKRLTELTDAVSASGVGDERADQAARTQLAEKLAGELAKIPPVTR